MASTKKTDFDPLAYIENAFLDKPKKPRSGSRGDGDGSTAEGKAVVERKERFRKTSLSAPRPRRTKAPGPDGEAIDGNVKALWEALPKNIEFLSHFFDDSVTSHYYHGPFKESRQELIMRLLDPELTLEEVSRLLGVCPATVRRYTNRGWLKHHRTKGGQRRFRLGGVVEFVEQHGRLPEE